MSSEEERRNREKTIMDTLVLLYNDQYGTNLTYRVMTEEDLKVSRK